MKKVSIANKTRFEAKLTPPNIKFLQRNLEDFLASIHRTNNQNRHDFRRQQIIASDHAPLKAHWRFFIW